MMPIVAAGFNRLSAIATLDDTIITAGLANCIAVAAIDRVFGSMRIAHYDTMNCMMGETMPAIPLTNFRDWFGNDTLEYRVGLGALWGNATGATAKMRHSLMMAIVDVFGHEPGLSGGTISLSRANGDFILAAHQNEALMPAAWSTMGTEIPYHQLR